MSANNTSSNSNTNFNTNSSANNKPNTVTYTKYNKTIHHHHHNHHHHTIDKPPHSNIGNEDKLIYLSKPKLKKLLIEKKLKDWSFGLI